MQKNITNRIESFFNKRKDDENKSKEDYQINAKNTREYKYNCQTNLNGVINAVYYMLTENHFDKYNKNISKDDIKEYCRKRRFIDTHVSIGTLKCENIQYWSSILPKVMQLNVAYMKDIATHFEADVLKYTHFTYNLKEKCKNLLNVDVAIPDFTVQDITDVFEVSIWLTSDIPFDTHFNLINAIQNDTIESYIPQIYGGKKMKRFETVNSRANISMVVTDDMNEALSFLWNDNSKATRKMLRDTMDPYFDKENINAFIELCKINLRSSRKKVSEQYNMYLLSNKRIENPCIDNYTNLTYYTNVIPFSDRLEHFKGLCEYLANKDYYTRYIKSYISTLYKCHKPGLIDPRKLGYERALECVPLNKNQIIHVQQDDINYSNSEFFNCLDNNRSIPISNEMKQFEESIASDDLTKSKKPDILIKTLDIDTCDSYEYMQFERDISDLDI